MITPQFYRSRTIRGALVAGLLVTLFPACSTLSRPTGIFNSSLNLMQTQSARAANVLRSRESRMQASRELTRSATELARRQQTDEAIKAYKAAIELWPAETDNYAQLATLYQQQNNLDAAIKQLSQGLSYDSNAIMLHLKMAELYLQKNQPVLALTHTDKVMELQQTNADCWRYRAVAHLQLNQIPDAMAASYQALAILPDDERVLELVCQIYFLQGRPMRAWSIVQKMSAKYTDETRPAKLRLLEAETLVQMNRNSDAIQTLKRWYLDGGDKDHRCCTMLTQCLDAEQKHQPLEMDFAPFAKSNPNGTFPKGIQPWSGPDGPIQILPVASHTGNQNAAPIATYTDPTTNLVDRAFADHTSNQSDRLQHNPLLWEQRPKFRPPEALSTDWR